MDWDLDYNNNGPEQDPDYNRPEKFNKIGNSLNFLFDRWPCCSPFPCATLWKILNVS